MSEEHKDKKAEEVEYIRDPEPAEEKAAEPVPEAAVKPAEAEESSHLKAKVKKRDGEIKQLKKDKEDLRDQLLRKMADMENLRKRLEREKSEYIQYALSDFLLEFLSILDNFERALDTPEEGVDGKTFREGIDLIYRMSRNLLAKQGVQPIEIKDGVFDPNLHHAMITEESEDVPEPRVGQELQKGYMLHARLLRPAMVKVIVPKKKE
jgi:molecular chaperone GrpE